MKKIYAIPIVFVLVFLIFQPDYTSESLPIPNNSTIVYGTNYNAEISVVSIVQNVDNTYLTIKIQAPAGYSVV
jgi:hypothetical protein